MSAIRVYVPSTPTLLRGIITADGIGPAPFAAHAVTDGLRAAYAEGGDEEWEYAAAAAAAHESLGMLLEDDEPRRVVVAVDVPGVRPVEGGDVTLVEVDEVVPFRRIAAVLADDDAARDAVADAVRAWADAQAGDAEAMAVVEACGDHELGWWASQEIGSLLGDRED